MGCDFVSVASWILFQISGDEIEERRLPPAPFVLTGSAGWDRFNIQWRTPHRSALRLLRLGRLVVARILFCLATQKLGFCRLPDELSDSAFSGHGFNPRDRLDR